MLESDHEFMETIEFGEIPEIDGSKFQGYIDFNLELEAKFIRMKQYTDSLLRKHEELKRLALDSIYWCNYWKNKYLENK